MEKEGEVFKVINNKVVIQINSLGYRLVADCTRVTLKSFIRKMAGAKMRPKIDGINKSVN
jgi:mRNA-degrading endonuclease HigB of HigAB toxin-antitoxin module